MLFNAREESIRQEWRRRRCLRIGETSRRRKCPFSCALRGPCTRAPMCRDVLVVHGARAPTGARAQGLEKRQ